MATLSKTKRREINRANAERSTGPKTAEGLARISRNALKHGLRAEKHALPNEDPQEAKEEALRWFARYQPRTEHQEELVGRIASACTVQRRCQRVFNATVAAQVLNADADIDQAHEAEVGAFRARLAKEPAAAVAGLRRTALGCRWLIGRWHELRQTLEELGTLAAPHHQLLARLRGLDPLVERPDDPELLAIRMHVVLSRPAQEPWDIDWVFGGVTADVRSWYLSRWGDPEANRQELRRRIDEVLAELTEREGRLSSGREAVERSTAADRALLIADPERARLWIRYSSESNSTYFRATRELQRSLEEHEGGEDVFEEARSPNEPNDPVQSSLSDDFEKSSDTSAAMVSETLTSLEGAEFQPAPPALVAESNPIGTGSQAAPPTPGSQPAARTEIARSPNEPNDPAQSHLNSDFVDIWVTKPAPVSGSQGGPARSARGDELLPRDSARRHNPRGTVPTPQGPKGREQLHDLPPGAFLDSCQWMVEDMKKESSSPAPRP